MLVFGRNHHRFHFPVYAVSQPRLLAHASQRGASATPESLWVLDSLSFGCLGPESIQKTCQLATKKRRPRSLLSAVNSAPTIASPSPFPVNKLRFRESVFIPGFPGSQLFSFSLLGWSPTQLCTSRVHNQRAAVWNDVSPTVFGRSRVDGESGAVAVNRIRIYKSGRAKRKNRARCQAFARMT